MPSDESGANAPATHKAAQPEDESLALAAVADALTDGLFRCVMESGSRQLRFQFLNAAIHRMLRIPPGAPALRAVDVFARIHPEDRGIVAECFLRAGRQETRWVCTFRLLDGAGGAQTVHAEARTLRNADGATEWHGSVRLLSDPEDAVAALRAKEERYRLAMEAVGHFVWEWDPDTDMVECDPRLAVLLGEPEAVRFRGQDWRDRLPASDMRTADAIRRARDAGESFDLEVRLERRDRSVVWLHLRGTRYQSQSAGSARVIGTAKDISQAKAIEHALAQREEQLRAMFDLSPLGMIRSTMDGRFLEVNPAFCEMLGYAPDALSGLTSWDITPALYAAQESIQLEAMRTTGQYGPYEKEFIHASGARIPVVLRGAVINQKLGGPYLWSIVENVREKREQEAQIFRHAHFDQITGLSNRSRFAEQMKASLEAAEAQSERCCVLFVDLDGLDIINNNLGHDVGDAVLAAVAQRLRKLLRADDLLARYGGDEFVIVRRIGGTGEARRAEVRQAAGSLALQALSALSEALDLGSRTLRLGASAGIALYPDDGGHAPELIRNADIALHHAKAAGPGRFRFFDRAMNALAVTRFELESALWAALEGDQLELFYQPQIDLASGRPIGFEALLRWHRPGHGLVLPSSFIPLAEASSLIRLIGDWVLERTCAQIRDWRRAGVPFGRISVNVSASQLRNHELADRVAAMLEATGVCGSDIEIEVTETALMEDPATAGAVLQRLRALGLRVAIDDFGAGYSSLAYLRRLPISSIKIDRAFVTEVESDANDAALAEGIVHLGHVLGLDVVAEGVETEGQRRFFAGTGCAHAQGFLFSPAMTAADVPLWLSDMPMQG